MSSEQKNNGMTNDEEAIQELVRQMEEKTAPVVKPVEKEGGHGEHHHHHHHHHSSRRRRRRIKKVSVVIGCIFLVLVLVTAGAVGAVFALRARGKSQLSAKAQELAPQLEQKEEELPADETLEEGVLYYQGEKYRYNEHLITILVMGIDSMEEAETDENYGQNNRSDANFLVVLDEEKKAIKLLSIPRDIMTDVSVTDINGEVYGTQTQQLALQYAYGDNGEQSCELMVQAVANLLYQMPIHGYAAVNMAAIAPLADAVGGVSLTIPMDLTFINPEWTEGTAVLLKGEEAYHYVHDRDTSVAQSAETRSERQKQYLVGFFDAVKDSIKADPTTVIDLYRGVAGYVTTDIDLSEMTYLGSLAVEAGFSLGNIETIEGTVLQPGELEEFYPDEDKLYDLIIRTFYEKVE